MILWSHTCLNGAAIILHLYNLYRNVCQPRNGSLGGAPKQEQKRWKEHDLHNILFYILKSHQLLCIQYLAVKIFSVQKMYVTKFKVMHIYDR